MGKYDTLESIHIKLKKELDQKITENQASDDFSYTLGIELLYRQTNNKSKWELLGRTIQQLETEKRTLQYLDNFFHTLDVSSVQDMNYGIFTYHNQIGTNKLDPKNIESIKQALEEERRNLGYTYNDLMKWKDQYEKQASKKVHPTIKR